MTSEAEVWKKQGNDAFAAKDFETAIRHFTKAIELDPNNHVLWSNRSACFASLSNFQAAKDDASKCVSIKPDWAKGYVRLGAAEHGLKQYDAAIKTYNRGLELEPGNESLKSGLDTVKADADVDRRSRDPFAKLFGPDTFAKVAANPRLQPFLAQPDYVQMIQTVSQNPQLASAFMKDQRMLQTFIELSGIDLSGAKGGAGDDEDESFSKPASKPQPTASSTSTSSSAKPAEKKPDDKKAPSGVSPAQQIKEEGNAHYKKREFDEALNCYHKALELEPNNTVFLLNITAVLFEKGEIDACLEEVEKALAHGKEHKAEYQTIVKLMTRKASCLQKKGQHADAIKLFKEALLEWRNPETLSKLEACEKEKKKLEEEAYRDPEIAKAKKEEGNVHFKEHRFPEGVACYSESIKRNPDEHTTYTNRAACYIKLGAYDEAIKDCDTCIKLKPDFVRAYVRKGNAYHFRKQYNMALQTYDAGLKIDAENEELKDGKAKTMQKITEMATGQGDEEDQDEVARRAMDDPEIRQIIGDSYMQLVLSEMQKDPRKLHEYMKDANIGSKLNKLITSGILRLGGKPPAQQQQGGRAGARR